MEPPHVMLGGEEECHSNESGWTMYIGSPRDEEAHCDDNEEKGYSLDYDYEDAEADPDVESDDSMASDASSGPSQYGVINPLGGGYDGITHIQQQKEEVKEKCCSDQKRITASKSKGNQVVEKRVEKNKMVLMSSKGKAPAV
ncbi:hypothetical protein PHAVU_009G190900 [Phaseolus vulgaris]|uniref:Uncharacterized protein n=1 Tax=Phaseolus vulgaris TaxID=3885 RepID=V7B027_PHAVU|nr:hypothetical protein PHAVU_009G190900g [Phaseolus vulgaris]ESW10218.1 hypothetical protein PHAVU_009G190900g [Phaseolus vulgaris]